MARTDSGNKAVSSEAFALKKCGSHKLEGQVGAFNHPTDIGGYNSRTSKPALTPQPVSVPKLEKDVGAGDNITEAGPETQTLPPVKIPHKNNKRSAPRMSTPAPVIVPKIKMMMIIAADDDNDEDNK